MKLRKMGMEGRHGEKGESPKEEARFTVRSGRRDDAADAARLWVRSAEEHTLYDHIYATAPTPRR